MQKTKEIVEQQMKTNEKKHENQRNTLEKTMKTNEQKQ